MKNIIIKCTFIFGIILSINACSTPEERSTVVVDSDTTITMTTSTDSNSVSDSGDADSLSGNADSSKGNKKVETFKHTPIDTITSLQDSNKQ